MYVNPVGLCAMLVGQLMRTMAMLEAANAFTHEVAEEKTREHRLVREGIYAYMRHPAYSGYFVWSVGTQLLLGNPLCLAIYCYVLYRFFSDRIRDEETHLLQFFPNYGQYRRECWSGIPGLK